MSTMLRFHWEETPQRVFLEYFVGATFMAFLFVKMQNISMTAVMFCCLQVLMIVFSINIFLNETFL